MSNILSALKVKAAAELATLRADGVEYVSALEAKIDANLKISVICGLAGLVFGTLATLAVVRL